MTRRDRLAILIHLPLVLRCRVSMFDRLAPSAELRQRLLRQQSLLDPYRFAKFALTGKAFAIFLHPLWVQTQESQCSVGYNFGSPRLILRSNKYAHQLGQAKHSVNRHEPLVELNTQQSPTRVVTYAATGDAATEVEAGPGRPIAFRCPDTFDQDV